MLEWGCRKETFSDARGIQTVTAIKENNRGPSLKVETELPSISESHPNRILKDNRNFKRNWYPNVHCSSTYNSQGLEGNKMAEASCMLKKWYMSVMAHYSVMKKNDTIPTSRHQYTWAWL